MRVEQMGAAPVTPSHPVGARVEPRAPETGQERPPVGGNQGAGANTAPNAEAEKAQLNQAIEQMNSTLQVFHQDLRLTIHETTNRMLIQVVNTKTKEVISEFPPKRLLDQLGAIQQMVGLLLDRQG